MTHRIAGVLPVVHTPLMQDDSIDWESLDRQVAWALDQGAAGVCMGMVTELLRLTFRERIELTGKLVESVAGRGVVVAGVGAESTCQALEYALEAERVGCDAMMALPPTTAALPAGPLLEYYGTLADRVALPLIVQDASSYVGQAIPLEVCVQLLERFGPDKVFFKPEANPVGPQLSALRDATRGQTRIFDGSGGIALVDSYRRGIRGTMPGMEFLAGIIALWKALQRGDEQAIYRLYLPICALVNLQLQAGLDGFLAIEKYVLAERGLFRTNRRRKPYTWEMDEETRQELHRLLELLDVAVGDGDTSVAP